MDTKKNISENTCEKPITWKCYRITGIPNSWQKATLLKQLQAAHQSFSGLLPRELQLYPACSGSFQVGLLYRNEPPECLWPLETKKCIWIKLNDPDNEEESVELEIDCHFYNLTPLNNPGDDIVAELILVYDPPSIVAVAGLTGHAYESWTHPTTHKMWLQHFLPKDPDIQNVRVMTYGYDIRLTRDTCEDTWLEYRRNFVQQLTNARGVSNKANERPIIFIGHDIGGILILQRGSQALLESFVRQADCGHILASTHAILFFGTPHQGLPTEDLISIVEDSDMSDSQKISRIGLLQDVSKNSSFLHLLADEIDNVVSGRQIFSIYETKPTPIFKKELGTGKWTRSGKEIIMVDQFSALTRARGSIHPFERNHTQLVRFRSAADDDYRTVVSYLTKTLNHISKLSERQMKAQVKNAPKYRYL